MDSAKKITSSLEDINEFMSVFPTIVEDLTTNKEFDNILGLKDHLKKLLHYVLPNGKKNRSMLLIATYKLLEKKYNITPDKMKRIYIFAWIMELSLSFEQMMDDIVDRSETRRELPCWHTINNRHLESINDALFLEQAVHFLFKKYFSDHQNYLSLLDLIHDVLMKVSIGQIIDCMCKKNEEVNWDYFTMENYIKMITYKAACSNFVPGVTAAMYLANVTDPNLLDNKELKTLLLNMGEFYQVHNDFWDCFGERELTGKIGSDIREGKCTWLAVKALEIANTEQQELMKKFYGKNTVEAEKRIIGLYEELDLKRHYADYTEDSLKKVCDIIEKVPEVLSHQLLYGLAEKIYKKSINTP